MFWYRRYRFIASSLRRNHFVGTSSSIANKKEIIAFFAFLLFLNFACKERFNAVLKPNQTNSLVVEGFINAKGITSIRLSRTSAIRDTGVSITESGATLKILGEDNSSIPLFENGAGNYQSDSMALNANLKYRLHIKTSEGKEYLSDYAVVNITPPIDAITWQNEFDGVNIYVNSHDKPENSRYYKWTFEKTWAIRSQWAVLWGYVNGDVSARTGEELSKMYYCWRSENSSRILVGSTVALTDNIISRIPVENIRHHDEQLRMRFSILVKQVSIDKQAYDFYQILKKNTESTGSVFGPLPSDLFTNIRCVSAPAEKVIGYVLVSTEEKQRIFISNEEVPGWDYKSPCLSVKVSAAEATSLFSGNGFIPYAKETMGFTTIGYYASSRDCMDCRTRGTNIPPDFW